MARTVTFLAARGQSFDVGFEAPRVLRVVSLEEWDGPQPVSIEELLSDGTRDGACRQVLMVDVGRGTRALGTLGELVLRECPKAEVHDLPPIVWTEPSRALLHRIAAMPDAPALLIVNPGALAQRLPELDMQGDAP